MLNIWTVTHNHANLVSLRNWAKKFWWVFLFSFFVVVGWVLFFVRIYLEQLKGSCNKILKVWVEVLIAYRIDSACQISHS